MSRFKLEAPFKAFRGKICKHSDIIYKKMKQTQYTSQICNPRTKPFSAEELSRQTKFTTVTQQVATIMADPTLRATYETAFKAQNKYTQLRGYIFAELYNAEP